MRSPTSPIAIMPAHDGRRRDVELRLDHHEPDPRRGDDELGADQGLPAETGGDAQARDDGGGRGRKQHLDDDAQVPRPEHLRRLHERPSDKAGAAIGVDEARRESPGEDDQDRAAEPGSEPKGGERHPGDRRDEAQGVEHRRHDFVEGAGPAHEEAQGDADRGAEEEAATEPEEAGREVPGQGRAREGCREEVKEAGGELVRGGQELPRHGAGER